MNYDSEPPTSRTHRDTTPVPVPSLAELLAAVHELTANLTLNNHALTQTLTRLTALEAHFGTLIDLSNRVRHLEILAGVHPQLKVSNESKG